MRNPKKDKKIKITLIFGDDIGSGIEFS